MNGGRQMQSLKEPKFVISLPPGLEMGTMFVFGDLLIVAGPRCPPQAADLRKPNPKFGPLIPIPNPFPEGHLNSPGPVGPGDTSPNVQLTLPLKAID